MNKLFWIATLLIVLMDGLLPALTFQTPLAKEGIIHLGYPDYFRVMLTMFKIAGSIILILPFFNRRLKEWAYAGFAFNFICACISHAVVDGWNIQTFLPLIMLAILALSYQGYNHLEKQTKRKESLVLSPAS